MISVTVLIVYIIILLHSLFNYSATQSLKAASVLSKIRCQLSVGL